MFHSLSSITFKTPLGQEYTTWSKETKLILFIKTGVLIEFKKLQTDEIKAYVLSYRLKDRVVGRGGGACSFSD